ncbi:Retrovirus-related Pol polyprotein from transposon [Trichinella pseudospiralis]|uniref:Retrovirus-related Pol polyprotein from transposon n=1 Tax=Trichinella pseudospiralis TaxID=6337 RepID=A0A0V1K3A6_TRIPS|nr:Retrovirus-related Pol polyprotein from transposon [Trichinella pseudospiralis]
MDPTKWLDTVEDFILVNDVPSARQAASARLLMTEAELRRRRLDTYDNSNSPVWLEICFSGLRQQKDQSVRDFASEVAEVAEGSQRRCNGELRLSQGCGQFGPDVALGEDGDGARSALPRAIDAEADGKPPEAPSNSATGEECTYAARGRCRCRWEAGGDASTSLLWKAWSILGTNFVDQYVKLIDWQDGEMTMTDGSKVRIVHKPAQATRPGIEYAWTTASPRGVPGEATEGERPENDGGELGTCERVLLDGAECSAQTPHRDRRAPRCVTEVRQFLGLASYYGREPNEEEVFTHLKEALVSPPFLGHPDFDLTFLLEVDASGDAVGAVLSQQGEQNTPAMIAASLGYPAIATVSVRQEVHRPNRPQRRESKGKVARSLERLAEFDFEVVPRAGRKHQNVDALSRRVCKQCGLEGSPAKVPVGAVQLDAANPIKQWQECDKELQQIREWSTQKSGDHMPEVGDLGYGRGTAAAGHPEIEDPGDPGRRPQPAIGGPFGRGKDAGKVTPSILLAPAMGRRRGVPDVRGTSGPDKEAPGTQATPAVMCEYCSKWPEAFALPNAEARTVAEALVNGLFCLYGAPETLHFDQELRSDGLVEQMNRTLQDLLAKASIDHPDDWDVHLDRVLLAYRSSVHHTTDATPTRVIFRREMRLPVELVYGLPKGAPEESVGEYTRRLGENLEQVYEAVRGRAGREQRRQKFWKDRKAHGPVYEPGD